MFKSLAPELGASRFALARNYRSSRALIEFFNASFPSVMAPLDAQEGGEYRPFEAAYEPMEVGGGDFSSRIEYHCVTSDVAVQEVAGASLGGVRLDSARIGSALLSSKESMAFRTALWIKHAVESSSPLLVRGEDQQQRAVRYDDIAVLMRTMARQYELEKYLRMFGIPFSTDTSMSMFSEEPINDLYFALRLSLDPEDTYATATVLRSPLCGISDNGYASLLVEKMSLNGLKAGLPEALLEVLSAEDRMRIERMVSFYKKLETSIDHLPLMELCDRVWSEGGIEAWALSDPAKAPYLEHWNAVRAIASDIEARGGQLQALLYELRAYMSKERKFESNAVPKQESRGLRLMTIHKSKGLEFPVVVIPWMEVSGNKRQSDELWGVLDGENKRGAHYRFFTADIGFHDRIESGSNVLQTQARELQIEKKRAETKRLLYVACTRAIDHLILFDAAPAKRAYDVDSFRALLLGATERWSGPPEDQKIVAHPHLGMIDFHFEPLASEGEVSARHATVRGARGTNGVEEPFSSASADVAAHAMGDLATGDLVTIKPPTSAPQVAKSRSKLTVTAFNIAAIKDQSARAIAEDLAGGFIRERIFEPASLTPPTPPDLASTEFGTLVHELFAHLASGRSPASFEASQENAAILSPETRARAEALLAPLIEGSFYWSLVARGAEPKGFKLEFPFLLRLSSWVVEGRMDLIADRGDEVIVLDLKTDQRYAPHEYTLQLGLYKIAAQKLFPEKQIRAGLLYLMFGEIAWLEREADEDALLRICDTISYNHTQY